MDIKMGLDYNQKTYAQEQAHKMMEDSIPLSTVDFYRDKQYSKEQLEQINQAMENVKKSNEDYKLSLDDLLDKYKPDEPQIDSKEKSQDLDL